MAALFTLLALFGVAFAAATILPLQSEALLTGLLLTTEHAPWALVAVASLGNILGSCVNWWLGRSIEHFKDRKWFPVKPQSLEKMQLMYAKYGRWSLLLSWVPLIGDPITVTSGIMKEKLATFVLFVGIAKTCRYIVVALLTLNVLQDYI